MVNQYINPVRNNYTPKLNDRKWLEPIKMTAFQARNFLFQFLGSFSRLYKHVSMVEAFDIVMAKKEYTQICWNNFMAWPPTSPSSQGINLYTFTLGVSQYHDSSEKMWRSIPKQKNEKIIELFLRLGYPKAIPIRSYIHPIPIYSLEVSINLKL